jgi:transcriptional regulator of met regulon
LMEPARVRRARRIRNFTVAAVVCAAFIGALTGAFSF